MLPERTPGVSEIELVAGILFDRATIDQVSRNDVLDCQPERLEDGDIPRRAAALDLTGEQFTQLADDVRGGKSVFLDPHHDIARFDERCGS